MTSEPHPAFSKIGACVFDAYGTLFDVNSAVARVRERLGPRADELGRIWREKQLQYSWLLTLSGRFDDFWHVTGNSLDYAMHSLGIIDPILRARLMETYLGLTPFPEVPAVLRRIKQDGHRTAVLSNGTTSMLTAVVNAGGLHGALDRLISAEEARVYKPHPDVYRLAVTQLGVPAERICFVSGNGWDVAGAAAFGFRCVWVNRSRSRPDRLPDGPLAELDDLTALPELLRPMADA